MSDFVGALSTGLSVDNVWGALVPAAGLVVLATVVAITRRILNKNTNSIAKGKAGKVN